MTRAPAPTIVAFSRRVWAAGYQDRCTLWEGPAAGIAAFTARFDELVLELDIDFDYLQLSIEGSNDGETWSSVALRPGHSFDDFTSGPYQSPLHLIDRGHGKRFLRIGVRTGLGGPGGPTIHRVVGVLTLHPPV